MKNTYTGHFFFVLSKGNNAGKPLQSPCPNCFVVFAEDEAERKMLYWLCFGLWQGKYFYQYLCGSVIPFIRINELKKVIREGIKKVAENTDGFYKAVECLHQLSEEQRRMQEQVKLIKEVKRAVMYKVLGA